MNGVILHLVLFLNVKKMLNDYFSDYEQKNLKQKLEILREEDIYKKIKTVDKAIQNIEAAIIASSVSAT